ncbi:MAG TPA: 2OG-Fe(II) oxygenase [Candidatus Acidoferrum sp.]|nr:2OG-Fe(II) oxygenase [Candidatus Acidoferrum sp.]
MASDSAQAASPVAPRPLEAGDPAPHVVALDEGGKPAHSSADLVTGRPLVLLFCPGGEAATILLGAFRDRAAEFAALDAIVQAVSREPLETNGATHAALGLPFKLLTDATGNVFRTYGAERDAQAVVLDPNHRVAAILRGHAEAALPDDALAYLRRAFPPRGLRVQAQAPILLLPRALAEAECARLIEQFHRPVNVWTTDGFRSAGHNQEQGDFKVNHAGVYGQLTEYVLREPALQQFLDQRFARRVAPEMRKAFQTGVTQRENYRIARYDSTAGGVLHPHRDNSTKETAHRRFTMTINLNAGEYEGGALRFREYGDHFYEVERGTAVVWSATLLHEVMPVTKGARYVLGVHMYGS